MTFGGYDLEAFAFNGSRPWFHKKRPGFSWDLQLKQVELRAQAGVDDSYLLGYSLGEGMRATIDSGTSYMIVSWEDAVILSEFFYEELNFTSKVCELVHGLATCYCSGE